MWFKLRPLVVLEEESEQSRSMAKLENRPWHSGWDTAWSVSTLEANGGLHAETTRDIRVIHELILFECKVAIDRQRVVDFSDECELRICNCQ